MNLFELFETLKWKPTRIDGYKTIWVDVGKLDASWKFDKGFYVGEDGIGGIGNRYQNFGEWLQQGLPIETPEVGLSYKNEITFSNGRHRTAYLRDHGIKKLPVTVPEEQADEIERRFGVKNRLKESILMEYSMSDVSMLLDEISHLQEIDCDFDVDSSTLFMKFILNGIT